jgi:hypothetical protein
MERVQLCKIAFMSPLPTRICKKRGRTAALNPTILSARYNNPHSSARKRIIPPNVHSSTKRRQIGH